MGDWRLKIELISNLPSPISLMSRTLILIRHSAVAVDPDMPAKKWPLSEDGRFRCLALAPHIASYQPDRFVTSGEQKAQETGQIIAGVLGVSCQTASDLHEHDRTGTPYFPSQKVFIEAVSHFFRHPDELVLGRETAVQAQTRFTQAVQTVMATHPTGNIAIVTHGTVLTLFAAHRQPQLDMISFWKSLTLPCAFVIPWPDVGTFTRV